MAAVNVGTCITKAVTKLTGSLPRPQFVTWFNEIVRDILSQPRQWQFLSEPASIAIVNNSVTLPDDMSEIMTIQVGDVFYDNSDLVNDETAAGLDSGAISGEGFTLSGTGVVTFHPAKTGTAVITGEIIVEDDYADNDDTIFPLEFENLFVTGLRMNFYDKDKDGRFTKENTIYQLEMYKLKAWDNHRKSRPVYSKRGYIK